MAAERSFDFWAIAQGRQPLHPSARLLGWSFIGFDEAAGALRCRFDPSDSLLNPVGIIQGGLLAAMLDETMGPVVAAIVKKPVFAQTLELKVSFLRAAKLGPIFGEGRIVHRGRKILFLEGRLTDAEGAPLATATATAQAIEPAS